MISIINLGPQVNCGHASPFSCGQKATYSESQSQLTSKSSGGPGNENCQFYPGVLSLSRYSPKRVFIRLVGQLVKVGALNL